MIILGLNAFHGDSSAALLIDGELVAAVEEERFRRQKHWAGFPTHAIAYCLSARKLQLRDVDHIAVNRNPTANLTKKVTHTLKTRPNPKFLLERVRSAGRTVGLRDRLNSEFPGQDFKGNIYRVEHHLAHLASSFLVSPYPEAAAVSLDGFGDFASAAWGLGMGTSTRIDRRVFFPHSLGIFYQALTQYLGFPNYGDEYKVMGLAPYGQPKYMHEMRQVVRCEEDGTYELQLDYFRHHKEVVDFQWDDCQPNVATIFTSALEDLLGPARSQDEEVTTRHLDIASSLQAMYEEAFFNLLNTMHDEYPTDSIILAGGCAMNSVANGKVHQRSPFTEMFVQAAPGDAGGAIGAAFTAWHNLSGAPRNFEFTHSYWGPSFDAASIEDALTTRESELEGYAVGRLSDDELIPAVADALASGNVVGWFQGRMEWGPRALGNRSILADPRREDMRDIINSKIKLREDFRPFAPSVLREHVGDWFESEADVPFMMRVFLIRSERRSQVPAVTHVDGSGRLHTPSDETNPRYCRLIREFHERTQVPMLLNTSFNENEPIVCTPSEALACFLRTDMDWLVLENTLVVRNPTARDWALFD